MKQLTIPLLILFAALVILPTFTPEDAFTTLPIIGAIGIRGYVLVCIGVIGLLWVTGLFNKFARMLHISPQVLILAIIFLLLIFMGVRE